MISFFGSQTPFNQEAFKMVVNGMRTDIFTLKNKNGLTASFCNYGARWLSFMVPDRNGVFKDIVLGFDSLEKYLNAEEQYHGATVGRVAGRIRQGKFMLDNHIYQLSINENLPNNLCNHLHGGSGGLSFRVWESKKETNEKSEERVAFTYFSPHGEEGYPGNLRITITYTLTNNNAITIEYFARTDKITPLSLSNHAYFNLSGDKSATILNHTLQISAGKFLELNNQNFCPTGKILSVQKTPMNFLKLKTIGADINANHVQLVNNSGYNVYYMLDKDKGGADAVLEDHLCGRRLEVFTTEPGLQLYCGGYWSGKDLGKHGCQYKKYSGVAIEAHRYPDAINNLGFPDVLLQPWQEYKQVTIYRVSNF